MASVTSVDYYECGQHIARPKFNLIHQMAPSHSPVCAVTAVLSVDCRYRPITRLFRDGRDGAGGAALTKHGLNILLVAL